MVHASPIRIDSASYPGAAIASSYDFVSIELSPELGPVSDLRVSPGRLRVGAASHGPRPRYCRLLARVLQKMLIRTRAYFNAEQL